LASNNPTRQELTVELAEFLTDPEFLGQWTESAGYLPTRPNALSAWDDPALQSFARSILPSANLLPTQDILTTIGPVLSQATISVLKEELDPSIAADTAAQSLVGP
jgi:ABC-type glycerol-3-phosphate transport system substrate-binding protein